MLTRRTLTLVATATLALGGCWGSIGDPGASGDACGALPEPGARRLSNAEYRNTVRDLFPGLDLPELVLVPDPAPYGFDNDAATLQASGLLVNQYNTAAIDVAERVRQHQAEFVPCMPADGSACGRAFIADLAPRAFRRPPTQAELDALQTVFDHYYAASGFDVAVELTTQTILQSPAFVYRIESVGPDGSASPYDVASRLSYLLWSTMPDAALFDAAAAGRLHSVADVGVQVDRMLADPRAVEGFLTFARQWLDLARLDRVGKNDPLWSGALREDLAEEARRFLTEIIFARGGTVRDLLTSPRVFVSDQTAPLYGLPPPPSGTWQETDLPAGRKGFLMQAEFLASHGHPNNPSPVLRGLFVLKQFMCIELGSPPAGVNMTIPEGDPTMGPTTNRQNYDRSTGGPVCRDCHAVINPIGYAFEQYDTFGRWRDQDNGLPIDPSGQVAGVDVTDAAALADFLADSRQVTDCVTKKYLTYAMSGPALGSDACLTRDLQDSFATSGGNLPGLIKAVATHPRFLGLVTSETSP
ncbi:MAG: DUF1592 domain-containing protein [Kofleriaceae bacterium]